jgi:hypothetical protein
VPRIKRSILQRLFENIAEPVFGNYSHIFFIIGRIKALVIGTVSTAGTEEVICWTLLHSQTRSKSN